MEVRLRGNRDEVPGDESDDRRPFPWRAWVTAEQDDEGESRSGPPEGEILYARVAKPATDREHCAGDEYPPQRCHGQMSALPFAHRS